MAQKDQILRFRAKTGLQAEIRAAADRDRRTVVDEASLALELGLIELQRRHEISVGTSQIDMAALRGLADRVQA